MKKLFFEFFFVIVLAGFLRAASCGNIGSSTTFTGNVVASGNCFNLTASNVVINCNGYSLTGSGSGDGFDVNNVSNVSILNCLVTGFTAGVNASEFNNLTIAYSNFTGNVYSINTWTPSYRYSNGVSWVYTAPPVGFIYSYGLNLFNNNFSDQFTLNNNPYSCNVIYNATIENNLISGNFAGHHLSNSTISFNNFTGNGNTLGWNSSTAFYNGTSVSSPSWAINYFYQYGSNLNLGSYDNVTSNNFSNGNSTLFFISPCSYNHFLSNNLSGSAFTGQFWCDNNVQACVSNGAWSIDASTGNNTFDYNNFTRNSTESPFIGFFNYRNNVNYLFENVTVNNWIDGKSVLYYSPWSNSVCPSNTVMHFGVNQYGFVGLVNCSSVTVDGVFYTGLGVGLTNNSLFSSSNVSGTSSMGLAFLSSNNDVVQNSNLTGNAVMLATTSLKNWFNSYNDYYGVGLAAGMGNAFSINNVSNFSINNVYASNFTVGVEFSQFTNLTVNNSNFIGNNVSMLQWNSPIGFNDPLENTHSFVLSTGLSVFNNTFADPTTLKFNPYQCEAIRYGNFVNNTISGTFFGHHVYNSSFSNNSIINNNYGLITLGGDFNVGSFNNLINNYFGNSSYEGSITVSFCSNNYFYNNTFLGGIFAGMPWCSYNVSTCIGMGGWGGGPTGNNTFDYNNFTRTNVGSPFLNLLTYAGNGGNYFFENATVNNWIDGKSVLYYSPWSNSVCPSNTVMHFGVNQYGFVALVNCSNITVDGVFYTGLGVYLTNNSLFNNCNVSRTDTLGLFLDNSNNNTLQSSNITTVGAPALWFYNANYNNILNDLILQTASASYSLGVGNSDYNLFANSYVYGLNSVYLYSGSNGNVFNNFTINTTSSYSIGEGGFYSGIAYNNTFENSFLNLNVPTRPFTLFNSTLILFNTALNASTTGLLNVSSFYESTNSTVPFFNIVDSNSSVLIQWFLNALVEDADGNAVYNVSVNVTNSSGIIVQNLTNSYGYTGWNVLSQEFLTNLSSVFFTPYTAAASVSGCVNGVYSASTTLTSSQIVIIKFRKLFRTLQLLSVSPSTYTLYNPNQNLSLVFEVFNPGCLSTDFNVTVYAPQGSFNCNSNTGGFATVYVPCGFVNLTSYANSVNVSLIPLSAGWSSTPMQQFMFYTSISNNVVVSDSNVWLILGLVLLAFFALRNKLGNGLKRKNS